MAAAEAKKKVERNVRVANSSKCGQGDSCKLPSSPERSSSSATPSRLVSLIPKLNFLRHDEETSDVIVKNFFSINMQILPNARRRDTRKRSSKNRNSFLQFLWFHFICNNFNFITRMFGSSSEHPENLLHAFAE